jgi:hypothetical protein
MQLPVNQDYDLHSGASVELLRLIDTVSLRLEIFPDAVFQFIF